MTVLSSFVVWSTWSVAFIVPFWSNRGRSRQGVINAVAMVAIMAVVHLVGYRLYRRQAARPPANRPAESDG